MTQQVEAGDVEYLGGTWSSDNDSSLAELKRLKTECNVASLMLAFHFRTLSCHIHERCDGNCGSHVGYHENPMIDPAVQLSYALFGSVGVAKTKATTQDIPRHVQWLEQQNLSPLVYSPINSLEGEIRLLRVKEAVFRTDIVECDLITASLDQCKDFIALSYCWGSNQQNEVLLCNGKSLHITASLHAALKAFRESGLTKGRLLWADAVSIDQYNDSEKSEQIPLMGRIYSEAYACFVYLGQGEPRVTQGLDLMVRLSVLQIHLNDPEKSGSIPTNALFTLLPARGHTCWNDYLRILTSPWFCRTWTLQEIALSKKALLGIGRYVVTWDRMEESTKFFVDQNLFLRVGPQSELAMAHLMNFVAIQGIIRIPQSSDPASALFGILRATRDFKVTDPRDKIYAILGLIGDLPDGLKTTVDYKLSPGEVFHRAALYMYRAGHANLLAHAGLQRQSRQCDMPSWVPDWYSDDRNRNELPLLLYMPETFAAGGQEDYMFMIGGSESSEFFSLGLCHHRITQASKPYANTKSSTDPTYSESKACYAWLDSARECIDSSGPLVYDEVEEAVARTFLVDDLYTNKDVTMRATAIQDPKMTFRAAMAEIDRAKRSNDPQRAFEGLTNTPIDDPVKTFIIQMGSAMRGRRFAITDTGYACLVPACAEIGDAVAVFFGHPTPFTIRLKPGPEIEKHPFEIVHAQLIGDTYMHGNMYGEMLVEGLKIGRPPCGIALI